MSIVESIKKARESGQSDEQILSEIMRQNEDKEPTFREAKERGVSATNIIEEIIAQNSPEDFSEGVYTKEMKEEEEKEREQFLRKMDSREKGEPLEEEIPPPPEPKPIPEEEEDVSSEKDLSTEGIPEETEEAPSMEETNPKMPEEDPYSEQVSEEDIKESVDEFKIPEEEKPAPDNIESVPDRPKEEDKMWVRIMIVLGLVALVAVVSAFFYWALFLEPPTREVGIVKPSLIEKEVYIPHTPRPLVALNLAQDNVLRFAFSSSREYMIEMNNISKKKLETQLLRIIAEDHRSDEPDLVDLEDFFSFYEVETPSGFFDTVEKDFTLLVYPEGEENRFGFVARIKEGKRDDLEWTIMRPWETKIEEDFRRLFSSLVSASLPATSSQLSETKYSYGRSDHEIRYREIEMRERSFVTFTTALSIYIYSEPVAERDFRMGRRPLRGDSFFVIDEKEDFYKIIVEEGEENNDVLENENNEENNDVLENENSEEENGDITENENSEEENGDLNDEANENDEEKQKRVTGWVEKDKVSFHRAYLEDVGLYYTITSSRFVFAMSLEGIKTIIRRL